MRCDIFKMKMITTAANGHIYITGFCAAQMGEGRACAGRGNLKGLAPNRQRFIIKGSTFEDFSV